jgi:hypothetical protein
VRMRLLAIAAVLLSVSLGARADTFTTFDISGTLASGSVLSGTITLDSTTGVVTAGDVKASSPDSLSFGSAIYQDCTSYGGDCLLGLYSSSSFPALVLVFDGSTYVGYDGGALGSESEPANGVFSDVEFSTGSDILIQGALTPTPEPSSFALLGTGVLGFVGVVRRKISR